MDTTTKIYKIYDGPGRDRLFDAIKYKCDKDAKVTVNFSVAIAYSGNPAAPTSAAIPMAIKEISINSIAHEDGSGQSFILEGYCKADLYTVNSKNVVYRPYIQ